MTAPLLTRAAAVAQVLVDDLEDPVLADPDLQHVAKVLRARPGESVVATDGRGGWRMCAWAGGAPLRVAGDVENEERQAPDVAVAFALLKGDRSEWVVQKLTELGVDRVQPIVSERTIVRWDEGKASRNLERLRRVAREAAMQSRRVWLPEVQPVAPASEVLSSGALIAQPGGTPATLSHPFVAVGPEGGWSEGELAMAPGRVDLGPTILRAETAAIAAGALLCAERWRRRREA